MRASSVVVIFWICIILFAYPRQLDANDAPATEEPEQEVASGGDEVQAEEEAIDEQKKYSPFRILSIITDRLKLPENWSGELSFGVNFQRGQVKRRQHRLETNVRITGEDTDKRYRLFYIFGKQNQQVSDDRFLASFRYRRNLSGPSFWQAQTVYETNNVSRINHQVRQTVGYGVALVERPRIKLDLVPGLAATYLERVGQRDPWKFLLNLDQNFSWQIADDLSFSQSNDILYEPTDDHNYRIEFKARLETRVWENINLALRYDFDYNTFVNPGVSRTTERFFTTLAYRF